MKLTPFPFQGTTYYLLLNGAALFNIYDQYGSDGSVFDPIRGGGSEGFAAVCWYLAELIEQGELYRRRQGHDRRSIPTTEAFAVELSPLDVPRAKAAIQDAILAGFSREEGAEQREVDVGLLELEKKTEHG